MWANRVKSAVLLLTMSVLFLCLGNLFGGIAGLQIAFVLALTMNVIAYFFSDRIVLHMYNAEPLNEQQYAGLYATVRELAHTMQLPEPKLWLIKSPMANAFATGRNPKNASIAVTTGIVTLLDTHELRGVLAHELSHVKNRDILISTIAATLATAIGYLANMLQHMALWNSFNNNQEQKRGGNPLLLFMVGLLMPFAAMLIQLALSRSREYLADETGAHYSHDPLALASALDKLQKHIPEAHIRNNDATRASTAPLFIVHPFTTNGWISLFSTHPPIALRIKRLHELHRQQTHRPW